MLALPSSSSPLRALIDVAALAEMAAPENRSKLRTLRDAINSARAFLSAEPTAREVNAVCVTADGHLRLIRIGPKGGIKRLWDFGALHA